MNDFVLPFQTETSGLRGRCVRAGDAVTAVLQRHAYPEPVALLAGEAMLVALTLASTLKYEGKFTLQASGSGPVRTLVSDVTSEGVVRAYAGFDADAVAAVMADAKGARPSLASLVGGGYLAFTVDQGEDFDRYQGIVELQGESLADCVHHYFRQSEQIASGIRLACRRRDTGEWQAGSVLLQAIPPGERLAGTAEAPEFDPDIWAEAMILLGSATDEEVADPGLPAETLLFRLLHEHGVRVFDKRAVEEGCHCGEGRMANVLARMPRDELEAYLIDDELDMVCEFCARKQIFTRADLDRIHADARSEQGD